MTTSPYKDSPHPEYDYIVNEVSDAVHTIMLQHCVKIKAAHPEFLPEVIALQVGKALIIEGCNFVGNAMGTGAEESIKNAQKCLWSFK